MGVKHPQSAPEGPKISSERPRVSYTVLKEHRCIFDTPGGREVLLYADKAVRVYAPALALLRAVRV